MKVLVKLYATLKTYAPPDTEIGEAFDVELSDSTIKGLIKHFGFKESEARIVMINGIRIENLNHELSENDVVVIFPPVGGG